MPGRARNVSEYPYACFELVTMTRSPTRHPVTGSAKVTAASPAFASAPSLTHVRDSGAPWRSMRPPHDISAGSVSLSIPSK